MNSLFPLVDWEEQIWSLFCDRSICSSYSCSDDDDDSLSLLLLLLLLLLLRASLLNYLRKGAVKILLRFWDLTFRFFSSFRLKTLLRFLPFFFLVTLFVWLLLNFFLSFFLSLFSSSSSILPQQQHRLWRRSWKRERERKNDRGQFVSDGPDRSWRNIQDGKV